MLLAVGAEGEHEDELGEPVEDERLPGALDALVTLRDVGPSGSFVDADGPVPW